MFNKSLINLQQTLNGTSRRLKPFTNGSSAPQLIRSCPGCIVGWRCAPALRRCPVHAGSCSSAPQDSGGPCGGPGRAEGSRALRDTGRQRGGAAVPSGAGWSGRGRREFPRAPLEGARGPRLPGPLRPAPGIQFPTSASDFFLCFIIKTFAVLFKACYFLCLVPELRRSLGFGYRKRCRTKFLRV